MTDADVLDIARDMIFTIIKCSAPFLFRNRRLHLFLNCWLFFWRSFFVEDGSWIIVWNFSQGYATILVPMLEGKHVIYNSEHGVLFACFNADIRLCVYGTIF